MRIPISSRDARDRARADELVADLGVDGVVRRRSWRVASEVDAGVAVLVVLDLERRRAGPSSVFGAETNVRPGEMPFSSAATG